MLYTFKDGRAAKYLAPRTSRTCSTSTRWRASGSSTSRCRSCSPRGSIKADAAVSVGLAAIGLGGVDGGWRNGAPLPEWELIPLKGRQVLIAFDSDVTRKASVRGGARPARRLPAPARCRRSRSSCCRPARTGRRSGSTTSSPPPRLAAPDRAAARARDLAGRRSPTRTGGRARAARGRHRRRRARRPSRRSSPGSSTSPATRSAGPSRSGSAHTHFAEHFDICAYLGVRSAVMESGKSQLLEILTLLVRRGSICSSRPTPRCSGCSREAPAPTLADRRARPDAQERRRPRVLIGLLNAGFVRGGSSRGSRTPGTAAKSCVSRCTGPSASRRSASAPRHDRTATIFVDLEAAHAERAGRAVADPPRPGRGARGARPARGVGRRRPATGRRAVELDDDLDFLSDRAAEDIWEPLRVVARLAGGPWPRRAEAAARALSGRGRDDDEPRRSR